MKFEVSHTIPHPLEKVFAAHRDELEKLAEYLPNIEKITVESREETPDGKVRLVNTWKAAASEIPKIARPFIDPEKLTWTDRAEWDTENKTCSWEIEIHIFKDAVKCKGQNRFTGDEKKTTVSLSGEVTVDASKIPGIPRLLAGKIGSAIESFVVKLISPNLAKTNEAVARMLEDKG